MGPGVTRPNTFERLIVAAVAIGTVYLLGLGFQTATGKLHVLTRSSRWPDGLILGALIVGADLYLWKQARDDAERKRDLHVVEVTDKVRQALNAGYSLGAEGTYEYDNELRTSPLYLDTLDASQREFLRRQYPGLIQHLPPHERERAEETTRTLIRKAEARGEPWDTYLRA